MPLSPEALNPTITDESDQFAVPPVGERIPLVGGQVLETVNPALLTELQAIDPRVRYFPAHLEDARSADAGYAYHRSVVDRIGEQVARDFAGTDVLVRGTVAALCEPFSHWLNEQETGYLDMRTVIDILATGSDRESDRVRVGGINERQVNDQTVEWLNNHYRDAMIDIESQADRDQTFPVLLVYKPEAFAKPPGHGWNQLAGEPSQRIAAVYITDKVVYS